MNIRLKKDEMCVIANLRTRKAKMMAPKYKSFTQSQIKFVREVYGSVARVFQILIDEVRKGK